MTRVPTLAVFVLVSTAAVCRGWEDSREAAAVRHVHARLHALVGSGDFERASELMSREAQAQLAGEYLLLAVELSRERPSDRDLRKLATACRKVVRRHGLGGAVPAEYFGDDEFTAGQFDELVATAFENLLNAVDSNGRRFEAMRDVQRAVGRLSPEEARAYLPYFAEAKVAKISIDGSTATLTTANAVEPEFHAFDKIDGRWVWSGFDEAAAEDALDAPFPLVENLRITGDDIEGKRVRLSDFRGKVVLIDFWGTWCTPCVAELSGLKALHATLQEKGFEVVGVAADDRDSLRAFLERRPLPWVNLVDGERGRIATRLGVKAYPTMLIVDSDGKHVASDLHGLELFDEIARQLELKPDEARRLRQTLAVEKHEGGSVSRDRDAAPTDSDEGEDR